MIEDCLKSVNWANEIILVDNESSDNTGTIAKKFTDKIFTHKNDPINLNDSKNFGFTKASGDWILSIDADERISPELHKEIIQRLMGAPDYVDGYLIPRKNIIFGKWIKHGLWYPDHQLRLFRKGKGKFPSKHNHELLEVKGQTLELKQHIVHLNYTSVDQYLNKIAYYYSDNEAEQYLNSGKKLQWYDAIRMPASDFLLNFFARSGYKDGLHGLALSLLQSFYMFIVFAKVWEKQGFWEYNSKEFLEDTKKEFISKGKELRYWISRTREENSGDIERLLLKVKRKLLP